MARRLLELRKTKSEGLDVPGDSWFYKGAKNTRPKAYVFIWSNVTHIFWIGSSQHSLATFFTTRCTGRWARNKVWFFKFSDLKPKWLCGDFIRRCRKRYSIWHIMHVSPLAMAFFGEPTCTTLWSESWWFAIVEFKGNLHVIRRNEFLQLGFLLFCIQMHCF